MEGVGLGGGEGGGGGGRGLVCPSRNPFDSKFHFDGIVWINFGNHIYPKYLHT